MLLVSAVEQSNSVTDRYRYKFLFILFSTVVYHRALNIVPCAIKYDLIVYPSYG